MQCARRNGSLYCAYRFYKPVQVFSQCSQFASRRIERLREGLLRQLSRLFSFCGGYFVACLQLVLFGFSGKTRIKRSVIFGQRLGQRLIDRE